MEGFEEKLESIRNMEELEELKHQLFRESVRIQADRAQIEADIDELILREATLQVLQILVFGLTVSLDNLVAVAADTRLVLDVDIVRCLADYRSRDDDGIIVED